MENLVLIGAGQQLHVVLYNIQCQNKYNVSCICDINSNNFGKKIDGIPIEEYYDYNKNCMDTIQQKYHTNLFFIALGAMKLRKSIYNYLVSIGWESVNIIHPHAVVSPMARLGKGVLIEAGCLITPAPIIGNNVVINTGSQVNHDNIIEDHVYIASGVLLSGGVTIKENTLLDDGVIVTLGMSVGSNCIIGAGAVVTKPIEDNVIAFGAPCKVFRTNDKY